MRARVASVLVALSVALAAPLARAAENAASPQCEVGWIPRVYNRAKASVARVEVPGGFGAGFLVFDASHVATAFHVVSLGRGARVRFSNGEAIGARVAAWSAEHDLAILELDQPAAGRAPLELGDSDAVDLGAPVAAIGHPRYSPLLPASMRGLLEWSVSQGIVSSKNDAFLQTDAPLNPGNSGGPVLGCDGRVLAVVSSLLRDSQGIAFAVPSKQLAALRPELARQRTYRGGLTFGDFGGGFATLVTRPDDYYGVYLGGSLIAFDRVSLTLRAGFAWGDTTNPNASTTTNSHNAELFALDLGYRFMLLAGPLPIYVVPQIGMTAAFIRRSNTQYTLNGAQVQLVDDSRHVTMVRSALGASLHLVGLQAAYTFSPDFGAGADSTHLFTVGFEL